MKPDRVPPKPFQLIEVFAKVWEEAYGEVYEKSGKDFRHAKDYLSLNGGDFKADTIIARAKVYMDKDGVYAENRHGFTAFINNIGSFVAHKVARVRTQMWTCDQCGEKMPESKQYAHWDTCPKSRPASPEQLKEVADTLKSLSEKFKA